VPGWTYELRPGATRRQLERLASDRVAKNAWLTLARALPDQPNAQLVVSSLRMALAEGGDSEAIRNDLGVVYMRQKRTKEAAVQFRAAEQMQPGYPPVQFNQALLAIIERRPAQALQQLGRYLARRPGDLAALRMKSALLAQPDRAPEALQMLEKFLLDQPVDQPLFLEAAVLAARLGQNGKALRYLETAMNGNPIQSVVRTSQSAAFRDIRLSGEGDALAARMASLARVAFGAPLPTQEIQPVRTPNPEAKYR
jgi:Flp pilus assembly protein TadD